MYSILYFPVVRVVGLIVKGDTTEFPFFLKSLNVKTTLNVKTAKCEKVTLNVKKITLNVKNDRSGKCEKNLNEM